MYKVQDTRGFITNGADAADTIAFFKLNGGVRHLLRNENFRLCNSRIYQSWYRADIHNAIDRSPVGADKGETETREHA